jgi:alanine dehydrogenase
MLARVSVLAIRNIAHTAEAVYACELIVKVKEPLAPEYPLLRENQILFCFLHLAPDPEQARHLLSSGTTAIAYETVTDSLGRLPLLEPMSEIAGRLSIQAGATHLQLNNGGRGVLLGGVPGVLPGRVVIIGGGVVGTEAARMALGLGAAVTVIDRSLPRLRHLDALYGPSLRTLYATSAAIEEAVAHADLVVGAVLIAGKTAPKLLPRSLIAQMPAGSVLVDVAIDQGGVAETSRPTSHDAPTYVVDGVVHYCVTNMPGACARSSTLALTNATLPYILKLADKGLKEALISDPGFLAGLNVHRGVVTYDAVAHDLGYPYIPPIEALA